MRKLFSLAMFAAIVGGGWYFVSNFKIEGLDSVRVLPQDGGDSLSPAAPPLPPPSQNDRFIRIATFNIQVFGPAKAANGPVMAILADIVRQFDVVAVQEIRSSDQTLIERFVERINAPSNGAAGRHYRYVLGPRLGRTSSKEQYAFLYDSTAIEIDPTSVYTLDDPEDLLHREPLVAQFRVRGPSAAEAFTFQLVNLHTDPDEAEMEVDALADAYRAVRQASSRGGVGEDDVILLGDFNAPGSYPLDIRDLGRLGQISGMQAAVTLEPTNTRRDKLYDNLVFHTPSTVEFTGRAGVLSVMRRYNLTSEEELAVSDHLPVWAEFAIFEDGVAGRLATRPDGQLQ
jgi:endonuclease/exonuclease/phosphatase family metal-dependent hydrolase